MSRALQARRLVVRWHWFVLAGVLAVRARRCKRNSRRSRPPRATWSASATSRTSWPTSTSRSGSIATCSASRSSATIPFGPNDAVAKFGHTEGGQSRVAVLKVPGIRDGHRAHRVQGHRAQGAEPALLRSGRREHRAARSRSRGAVPEDREVPRRQDSHPGGKPATLTTPNGTLHAVFVQDPDGFVVEMLEAANPPADAPPGFVVARRHLRAHRAQQRSRA